MTAFIICSTIFFYLVTIPYRRARRRRIEAQRAVTRPVYILPVNGVAPPQAPASMLHPKSPEDLPGYMGWGVKK